MVYYPYVVNSITFYASVEAHGNRIVIPKKKADTLNLKPDDEVKVVVTKT